MRNPILVLGVLLLAACGGGGGGGQQGPQVQLKSLAYNNIVADKQGVALYLRADGKGIVRQVFPVSVPPETELGSLDLHAIALGETELVIDEAVTVAKPVEKRIEFSVEEEVWRDLAVQAEDGPDGYDLLHTPDSRELEAERAASGAGRPTIRPGSPEDMAARLRLTFSDGTEKVWSENDAEEFPGLLIFFRRVATLAEGKSLLPPQPDDVLPYEKDFRPPGY